MRFIALAGTAGAGALTLIGALAMVAPQLGLVTTILSTFVQALVYAALVGAALFGSGAVRVRWLNDGMRVWAAMAIIGFFMFIVMFVAFMVAGIVLVAGPLGPYMQDLQNAGSDSAQVLAVMTRFAEANQITLLALTLFIGGIWLLLTSRLYLAAPASVDQQRILTFETWKWTKGGDAAHHRREAVAAPARQHFRRRPRTLGRGASLASIRWIPRPPPKPPRPTRLAICSLSSSRALLTFALYSALEAGLSSYLYRGLKPADARAGGRR